jgi:hypothetical protein
MRPQVQRRRGAAVVLPPSSVSARCQPRTIARTCFAWEGMITTCASHFYSSFVAEDCGSRRLVPETRRPSNAPDWIIGQSISTGS